MPKTRSTRKQSAAPAPVPPKVPSRRQRDAVIRAAARSLPPDTPPPDLSDLTRSEKREREQAILREPDILLNLCEDIGDGLTLLEVARAKGLRYGVLYAWIHDQNQPERLKSYAVALESQKAFYTDGILGRLLRIGQATLAMCYDKAGALLPIHKMPPDVQAALKEVEESYDEDGNPKQKIKLQDNLRAMELLGKHTKMFTDRIEHSGKVTMEDLVNASMGTT